MDWENKQKEEGPGTGVLNPEAGGRFILSYRGKQKYTRHVEVPREDDGYTPTAEKLGIPSTEDKSRYDGIDHGYYEGYEECKASSSSKYPYREGHPPCENLSQPAHHSIPKGMARNSYKLYRKGFDEGFERGWARAVADLKKKWEEEDAGLRDNCGHLNFSYNGHPRFKRHNQVVTSPSSRAKAIDDIEKDSNLDFSDGFDHGYKEGEQVFEKPTDRPSDLLAIPITLTDYRNGFDAGFRFGLRRTYALPDMKREPKDE